MSDKPSTFTIIILAIFSILGSGILFLPSFTYSIALNDVFLSWILIILVCISSIIFLDVKKLLNTDSSVSDVGQLIGRTFGKDTARFSYFLLLGTVVLGMPAAVIVIADYAESVFGGGALFKLIISYSVLLFSYLLKEMKFLNLSIVAIFITMIFISFNIFEGEILFPAPDYNISNIISGSVASFWAFAGFENILFIAKDIKEPEKKLKKIFLISIVTTALIYLFLVALYSSIIPISEINQSLGLLQITMKLNMPLLTYFILFFAFMSVIGNLISWSYGISIMLQKHILKFDLSRCKRLFFLTLLLSLALEHLLYDYFDRILVLVSQNFLVLYLLLLTSLILKTSFVWKKIFGVVVVLTILGHLLSSPLLLVYPLLIGIILFNKNLKTYFVNLKLENEYKNQ